MDISVKKQGALNTCGRISGYNQKLNTYINDLNKLVQNIDSIWDAGENERSAIDDLKGQIRKLSDLTEAIRSSVSAISNYVTSLSDIENE